MKGTKIVWFKNDLRLKDNEMLYQACKADGNVLPIYIFDPREYRMLDHLEFKKTSSFRTKFIIESVQCLRKNLKKVGGDLIVRVGSPEKILPELADKIKAKYLFYSKEVATEELNSIEEVESKFSEKGITCEGFWQSTLMHEQDVPWPIKQVPNVFTDFRKEAEKEAEVRSEFSAPSSIDLAPGIDHGEIPTLSDLDIKEEKPDERAVLDFKGGEDEAWNRLNEYIWEEDLLKKYKATRNGLLGANYSSKFSPWLSVGAISAKSIYYQIKKYEDERHKNRSTYWLFFELMWRDFFKYMAKKNGSDMFKTHGIGGEPPEFTNSEEDYNLWKKGETGEPFVDANMKELLLTGYMSNRGRQNAASYLIHNLKVDWTWGAAWYENRLIDYDPCSNWLNWAYIAGVGNDPRQGRQFNIESQQQRYDPKGEYVDYWLVSKPV